MANRRDLVRMTPEEVDDFLAGPHTMTMCSLAGDGTIHAVAMFYGFLDGSPAVHTKAKSQKVRNLERDDRLTVLVETGTSYEELRGVELVGRAEIIHDPQRLFELGVNMQERYHGPFHDGMWAAMEERLRGRVAVRIHVDRVVSWDHRKLTRR